MFSKILQLKRLALRNLTRHKVKSILTITAVTVSVGLYIVMDGWIVGMNLDSRRNIVNYETGAVKLQSKTYFDRQDELPMYENFGGWESYAAALDNAGYDSAPRFVFTGALYSETGSAPVVINGVDPDAEARLFRYGNYLESGRCVRNGGFELVLGNMTAEKLKVGILQRPTEDELEHEILPLVPGSERNFAASLYEPAGEKAVTRAGVMAPREAVAGSGKRMILKRNIPREDLEKYWKLLADAGRMNVRLSTVVDIKAVPDSIRKEKHEVDLDPYFSAEEKTLFEQVYEYDPLTEAWFLSSDDSVLLDEALKAMIRVDYSGAIRHVNQLIDLILVGIVNSPNPKTNNNIGWIPLDILQDEAGFMLEGRITELLIRQKKASDSRLPGKNESPEAINAALLASSIDLEERGLGVFGWQGYVKDYLAASAGDNISTRIMVVILFVLSFLGIANTMLLAILERTKEIGMMRAQGMTDVELILAMMLEAGMMGLIGSVLGTIIGCLANIPMVEYGINFTAMADSMGGDIGYRVTGIFKSAWNIPVIIGSGILAAILSSFMAFFPTRRALGMPVAASLRFE